MGTLFTFQTVKRLVFVSNQAGETNEKPDKFCRRLKSSNSQFQVCSVLEVPRKRFPPNPLCFLNSILLYQLNHLKSCLRVCSYSRPSAVWNHHSFVLQTLPWCLLRKSHHSSTVAVRSFCHFHFLASLPSCWQ